MREQTTKDEHTDLLRRARDFVGKSRCSTGHSVSEVFDRANPKYYGHCIYCQRQMELYNDLVSEIGRAADEPEAVRLLRICRTLFQPDRPDVRRVDGLGPWDVMHAIDALLDGPQTKPALEPRDVHLQCKDRCWLSACQQMGKENEALMRQLFERATETKPAGRESTQRRY
jgi:hypothetical protein